MLRVQAIEVPIAKTKALLVLTNPPGAARCESYLRLLLEDRNHSSQETRIGVIVGLGDPNVAPTRHVHALVPLLEHAPGILCVEFDLHFGIVTIGSKNLAAIVCRAIIQ